MKKAQLIIIDGGDNAGKATQVDLLMRRLVSEVYTIVTKHI